jgi:tripartite-type tricarboxylate transporter receptor subunit TctC
MRGAAPTILLGAALALAPHLAHAQAPYPSRTIEIIVAYGAGGSTDFVARTIGQKLQERWNQSIVVLNRPGGAGTIGVTTAARAAPDGYTLFLGYTSELVVAPQVNRTIKYSVDDFEPIAVTGIVPVVLIAAKTMRADNLKDLIEEIRLSPGKYTFAGGTGSPSHILGSWLNRLKGLETRHIPNRDGAQSVADVVGGHADMFYAGISVGKPAIDAGSVKAIAIAGVRSSALPNVPTFGEAGLADFDLASWNVLLAPKGTPADVVDKLRKEVLAILQEPQVRATLSAQGIEASQTQDVRAFLAGEREKFGRVLRDVGITIGQ